jgi:hypothetical protein
MIIRLEKLISRERILRRETDRAVAEYRHYRIMKLLDALERRP